MSKSINHTQKTLKTANAIADKVRDALIATLMAETYEAYEAASTTLQKAITKATETSAKRAEELNEERNGEKTVFGRRGDPEAFEFVTITDPAGTIPQALMATTYFGRENFSLIKGLNLTHCREKAGPEGKNLWVYELQAAAELAKAGKHVVIDGQEFQVS
jgi:hypothetical protein